MPTTIKSEMQPNYEEVKARLEEFIPSEEDLRRLDQVINILNTIEQSQIEVALAGGYGMDALVGRLTRAHHDLDLLAVNREHLRRAVEVLQRQGYLLNELPEKAVMWLEGDSDFTVEIASAEILDKYSSMTSDQFIPENYNGSLNGVDLKTIPIEAQQEVRRIQSNRLHGSYDQTKEQNWQDIYTIVTQENM